MGQIILYGYYEQNIKKLADQKNPWNLSRSTFYSTSRSKSRTNGRIKSASVYPVILSTTT